jgi:hypothetical protein
MHPPLPRFPPCRRSGEGYNPGHLILSRPLLSIPMGLFDYFIPDPPIKCPKCGHATTGWHGKHGGDCCLFVWRQGRESPVDQLADKDCRLDSGKLATCRLERAAIPISGGECKACGYLWWHSSFHVTADASSGVWTETKIDPPPLPGIFITDSIVQCPSCADVLEPRPEQHLMLCETCRRLVLRTGAPPGG